MNINFILQIQYLWRANSVSNPVYYLYSSTHDYTMEKELVDIEIALSKRIKILSQ